MQSVTDGRTGEVTDRRLDDSKTCGITLLSHVIALPVMYPPYSRGTQGVHFFPENFLFFFGVNVLCFDAFWHYFEKIAYSSTLDDRHFWCLERPFSPVLFRATPWLKNICRGGSSMRLVRLKWAPIGPGERTPKFVDSCGLLILDLNFLSILRTTVHFFACFARRLFVPLLFNLFRHPTLPLLFKRKSLQ